MNLTNKTAVVTGTGQGIGRAVEMRLGMQMPKKLSQCECNFRFYEPPPKPICDKNKQGFLKKNTEIPKIQRIPP